MSNKNGKRLVKEHDQDVTPFIYIEQENQNPNLQHIIFLLFQTLEVL